VLLLPQAVVHHILVLQERALILPRRVRGTCSVSGCGGPHKAKGFCEKHYLQSRSTYPHTDGNWRGLTLIDRLVSRIRLESDTGCWIWEGLGQAILSEGSASNGTHKARFGRVISYEYFKGPVLEGFEIVPLCKDPLCLNPRHLESVVSMTSYGNSPTVSAMKTRDWRARNPSRSKRLSLEQAARRRARFREWLDGKKSGLCMDCGGKFPRECMDFDHVRGKKLICINMASGGSSSMERLEAEIKKCDLVCANCHRIRTRKNILARGYDSVFEYRCDHCGNLFECRQRFMAVKFIECPGCGASGLIRLPLTAGGQDAHV
jgi:putative FmdB family regulatory protein